MAKNTKTGEANVPAVRRRCFLIGPIGSVNTDTRRHADWLLKGIVEPVFKSSFPEFDVVRSDRIAAPGMIDAQVINLLLDADLVIADMSKLNPNAFYELGIRHMAQKPTVHMFLVGEEIPFDVAPYRAIGFSLQDPDDLAAAQKQLRESVEASLAHDFKVENPVTRARGTVKLVEDATPEQRIMLGRIEALEARLGSMTTGAVRISAPIVSATRLIFTPLDGVSPSDWRKSSEYIERFIGLVSDSVRPSIVTESELIMTLDGGVGRDVLFDVAKRLAQTHPVAFRVHDSPV